MDAAAALTYAVQAVALGAVLLPSQPSPSLVVEATLGGAPTAVGSVAPAWAAVTVLVGGAAAHLLAVPGRRPARRGVLLAAAWSQGAGILVFLVALLNGIRELSALVPMYALAASAVLLQAIDPGPSLSTWRRPGSWAAAVGIVPWGVIGFTQIGSGIAGAAPSPGVRVLTLVALAVVAIGWALAWRRRVDAVAVLAMTVGVSLTAWSVALLGG